MSDQDGTIVHALTRAAVYRVLARALAYPTPPALTELGTMATRVVEAPTAVPAVRTALAEFGRAVAATDPEAVTAEHVRLFDGTVACPPYEGAYGQAPQMAGKAAQLADVAGFYAAFGLAPAAATPEIEDHVGAELEFMSALALKEAHALGEDDGDALAIVRSAEVGFLGDHLGRWAGAFARELAAASTLPYYATAAALLDEWVAREVEALGATPVTVPTRAGGEPGHEDAFTCPLAPE